MSNPLSPAEAKELIRLYETGRLYDVEAWIAIGVKERISVLRARLQAATALAKGDHDGYESAGREILGDFAKMAIEGKKAPWPLSTLSP